MNCPYCHEPIFAWDLGIEEPYTGKAHEDQCPTCGGFISVSIKATIRAVKDPKVRDLQETLDQD